MPGPRNPVLAAVAAAILGVTACTGQQSPVPMPSTPQSQASPTYACTPVAGGTPYACYENQYQDAAAQAKLYADAEAVYRRYHAEDERIFRVGGSREPSQILLETTTGVYRQDSMSEYRSLEKTGRRLRVGSFRIVWTKPVPDVTRSGSVATLEVCIDGSAAVITEKNGASYSIGDGNAERLYFVRDSGTLKIGDADHKRLEKC